MSHRDKFKAACNKLAMEMSVAEVASKLMENARPVVDAGLQKLSKVNESLPARPNSKTNPPRALRPRGLAIARLLAQGKSVSEIASALGITRQAIWKWSRRPEIIKEVNRAHTAMLASSSRSG